MCRLEPIRWSLRTAFLLDALKNNRPAERPLQTLLLEMMDVDEKFEGRDPTKPGIYTDAEFSSYDHS